MAEKTIVDKAAFVVGFGIAAASGAAEAIKSVFSGGEAPLGEVSGTAPVAKAPKKSAAKKAATKVPAKKTAVKKAPPEKMPAKKAAAKKAPAKKSVAKKASVKHVLHQK